MAVPSTFGILGPAPAGRLPTLHLAVVTAPRPRSASFTDRPTPLAASRSRRRGCPSTGPPGPPARLGSLHPRASGSFWRAGYTGARAMRIRLVSVGPASSDHVPPLAARPPSSRLPLICGTSPLHTVCGEMMCIRKSRLAKQESDAIGVSATDSGECFRAGPTLRGSPLHPRGRAALRRCGLVPRMVLQPVIDRAGLGLVLNLQLCSTVSLRTDHLHPPSSSTQASMTAAP